MVVEIKKSTQYNDKIVPNMIHGKHPYKIYLEIKGNSNIGKYIVVISNQDIKNGHNIDSVTIKRDLGNNINKNVNTMIVKPNTVNNMYYTTYRVKEVSILDVIETEMYVYECIGKNGGKKK